jgi:hypothetical protein
MSVSIAIARTPVLQAASPRMPAGVPGGEAAARGSSRGALGPVDAEFAVEAARTASTTPAKKAPTPQDADGPSAFASVLQSLGGEMRRGESLMRSALGGARGGALGPGELIALQAGIYRYGEAVDLASRLVDRATSAVKTVVQGS